MRRIARSSGERLAERRDLASHLRVGSGAHRIHRPLGRGERGACGTDVAARTLDVPPVAEKVNKPQLVADLAKQGRTSSE